MTKNQKTESPALTKIRAKAIAIGDPVAILNLNPMGSLYVLRTYWEGCEKHSNFIETVNCEVTQ